MYYLDLQGHGRWFEYDRKVHEKKKEANFSPEGNLIHYLI